MINITVHFIHPTASGIMSYTGHLLDDRDGFLILSSNNFTGEEVEVSINKTAVAFYEILTQDELSE